MQVRTSGIVLFLAQLNFTWKRLNTNLRGRRTVDMKALHTGIFISWSRRKLRGNYWEVERKKDIIFSLGTRGIQMSSYIFDQIRYSDVTPGHR